MSTEAKNDVEPVWDARDVARFLKVSRSWVYAKAESGELPSMRICGALRFDPQAIRERVMTTAREGRVMPFERRTPPAGD